MLCKPETLFKGNKLALQLWLSDNHEVTLLTEFFYLSVFFFFCLAKNIVLAGIKVNLFFDCCQAFIYLFQENIPKEPIKLKV